MKIKLFLCTNILFVVNNLHTSAHLFCFYIKFIVRFTCFTYYTRVYKKRVSNVQTDDEAFWSIRLVFIQNDRFVGNYIRQTSYEKKRTTRVTNVDFKLSHLLTSTLIGGDCFYVNSRISITACTSRNKKPFTTVGQRYILQATGNNVVRHLSFSWSTRFEIMHTYIFTSIYKNYVRFKH